MTETREVFTISRQLEYLSENELKNQFGYSREQWPLVLIKELIDNAMDNCEEIGTAPEVAVTITGDAIIVTDNGSGIEPSTVEGMLDPDNRVSSREAWRTVTRGLQGNASKCLLGFPYAWNPSQPGYVRIRTQGLLPTVATSRGRHVYARAEPGAGVAAAGGKSYLDLGDGEFRCGSGAYNLLPVSVHPSGIVYTWTVPLDQGIPLLTVESTGSLRSWGTDDTQHTQQAQQTQDTQQTQADAAMKMGLATELRELTLPIGQRIEKAIQATLPHGPGQRNRAVLALCRALKAIPECAGHPSADFRNVVKAWHAKAMPVIRTKEFEETWLDFNHTWANVRHAIGEGLMSDVLRATSLDDLPPQTRDYDRRETKLLVGVCRELQRRAGDQPFFLGCRTAAELLCVEHNTAARWLRLLIADKILEPADAGTPKGHSAASYRYVANSR